MVTYRKLPNIKNFIIFIEQKINDRIDFRSYKQLMSWHLDLQNPFIKRLPNEFKCSAYQNSLIILIISFC